MNSTRHPTDPVVHDYRPPFWFAPVGIVAIVLLALGQAIIDVLVRYDAKPDGGPM
jgi:hypothetical protein